MATDDFTLDDLDELSADLGSLVMVDEDENDDDTADAVKVTKVEVTLSEDKLRVLLSAPDPSDNVPALARKALLHVQALGLAAEPTAEQLAAIIEESVSPGRDLHEMVLLEGFFPVEPVDGYIDWKQDFFAEGFVEDPVTGAIDYWNRLSDLSVAKGDLLATVVPSRPGSNGRNLLGEELTVGEPHDPAVIREKSVETSESGAGLEIHAAIDGRLRWANDTIAVDDVYVVKGSVGIDTGHIDHPGAVIIAGDIKAGASIKARGDILVKGMVEACNIEAAGNLTVHGGIVGGEGVSITVDGGVQAKHILEAKIVAGEDIVVSNEVAHCEIATRGSVRMPRGRIIGSKVEALGDIEVQQAGGEGLDKTWLAAAVDCRLETDLRPLQLELSALEETRTKLRETVETRKEQGTPLSEKEKAIFKGIVAKSRQTEERIRVLVKETNTIKRRSQKRAGKGIYVSGRLAADTIVQVREARTAVPHVIERPCEAYYHRGKVTVGATGETMV